MGYARFCDDYDDASRSSSSAPCPHLDDPAAHVRLRDDAGPALQARQRARQGRVALQEGALEARDRRRRDTRRLATRDVCHVRHTLLRWSLSAYIARWRGRFPMRPASSISSARRSGRSSASSSWARACTRRRPRTPVRLSGRGAAADRLGARAASSREECDFATRFPGEDPGNLQRVALAYEIDSSRARLVNAITDAVDTGRAPSPMLHALARLDFPLVITTNYDQLFERALQAAGKRPRVVRLQARAGADDGLSQTRRPTARSSTSCTATSPTASRSSSPTRTTSSSCCG